MNDKHSEAQLQDCYEQRKRSIAPPSTLTDAIISKANSTQKSPWRWLNWQYAAIMFVCVIIFGLNKNTIQVESNNNYLISATMNEQEEITYYHDVQLQKQTSTQDAPRSKPEHYAQYVESLAKASDNKRLIGVVQSIDSQLVVNVCQVGVFELSADMVRNLLKNNSAPKMYVGTTIYLNTDDNGFIQSIEKRHSNDRCPS